MTEVITGRGRVIVSPLGQHWLGYIPSLGVRPGAMGYGLLDSDLDIWELAAQHHSESAQEGHLARWIHGMGIGAQFALKPEARVVERADWSLEASKSYILKGAIHAKLTAELLTGRMEIK